MKKHSYIIALVSAFVAGIVAHSIWIGSKVPLYSRKGNHSVTALTHDKPGPDRPTDVLPEPAKAAPLETETGRMIKLSPKVVDAILSGGNLERKLSRMGLSPEQVAAVATIQAKGVAAMKQIEMAHAKPISDSKGDYVSINPFPAEREKWLGDIESDIRSFVADDRSAIIARLVAFSDNDEAVGLYRREIFITEAQEAGRKMRIEERTFAADGQHIDSDYESVDSRSQSRWGHLLEFPK